MSWVHGSIFASFISVSDFESNSLLFSFSPPFVLLTRYYRGIHCRSHPRRFTFVKKLLLQLGHTYSQVNNERSLRCTHTRAHAYTHTAGIAISIKNEFIINEKRESRLQPIRWRESKVSAPFD